MICISVNEQNFSKIKEILEVSPMAEIRADLCKLSLPQIDELLSLPNILFTCRIENSSREFAYEQMVHAIKKGAKMVDVEIEAPIDHLDFIKQYANDCRCKLIISYHDFNGTASYNELEQIFELCLRKGADIVKIVTTANSTEDAVRVMKLYNSKFCNGSNLVAFCMGSAGKFTRKLCLDLGSPFTYVAYDDASATAPGQFTFEEFKQAIEPDKPKFATGWDEGFGLPAEVEIPCSKSVAQRAILAAAFAKGESVLSNFSPCNDITGAVEVIKKLGCEVEYLDKSALKIISNGIESWNNISKIFVGESGLLTRLLFPVSAYLSGVNNNTIEITGHGSILKRNLKDAFLALRNAGAICNAQNDGYLPATVSGGITNNNITFSGKESSQIVSGFLMTLPMLSNDTTLTITNPTSIPYINITLDCLKSFGIAIEIVSSSADKIVYSIKGGQKYSAGDVYLESDWSSAAFFAVGGAIKGGIVLKNMPIESSQADILVLDLLRKAGADVSINGNDVIIKREGELKCFEADLTNAPDLFPIAAVLALKCKGKSALKGVSRLFQKESNRAESVYSEFSVLGADISIEGDYMYINESDLKGGFVSSHNDHRIAMSIIIASLFINDEVFLDDVACINKSFPEFLNLIRL